MPDGRRHGHQSGVDLTHRNSGNVPGTLEVAQAQSAAIWNDGPHVRYRSLEGLQGHRIWAGWPSNEVRVCWMRLIEDILAEEPRTHRSRKTA